MKKSLWYRLVFALVSGVFFSCPNEAVHYDSNDYFTITIVGKTIYLLPLKRIGTECINLIHPLDEYLRGEVPFIPQHVQWVPDTNNAFLLWLQEGENLQIILGGIVVETGELKNSFFSLENVVLNSNKTVTRIDIACKPGSPRFDLLMKFFDDETFNVELDNSDEEFQKIHDTLF